MYCGTNHSIPLYHSDINNFDCQLAEASRIWQDKVSILHRITIFQNRQNIGTTFETFRSVRNLSRDLAIGMAQSSFPEIRSVSRRNFARGSKIRRDVGASFFLTHPINSQHLVLWWHRKESKRKLVEWVPVILRYRISDDRVALLQRKEAPLADADWKRRWTHDSLCWSFTKVVS